MSHRLTTIPEVKAAKLRRLIRSKLLFTLAEAGPRGVSRTWLLYDFGPALVLDPILDRYIADGLVVVRDEPRAMPFRGKPTIRMYYGVIGGPPS